MNNSDRSLQHTHQPQRRRRGSVVAVLLIALAVLFVAAGCGSDGEGPPTEGEGPERPEETVPPEEPAEPESPEEPAEPEEPAGPPETTAPPDTAPPPEATTEPAATAEPAAEDSEDGLSSEDWLMIVLVGIAIVAVIAVVVAFANRRSGDKAAANASLHNQLAGILGSSRRVADQGSVDILRTTDAGQLNVSWPSTRDRMVDLEQQIATVRAGSDDEQLVPALGSLGQAVAALRGALESLVGMRLASDVPDQSVIDNGTQIVEQRRQELDAAISGVQAA